MDRVDSCLRCHKSCATCYGGRDSNCLSCYQFHRLTPEMSCRCISESGSDCNLDYPSSVCAHGVEFSLLRNPVNNSNYVLEIAFLCPLGESSAQTFATNIQRNHYQIVAGSLSDELQEFTYHGLSVMDNRSFRIALSVHRYISVVES